MAVQHHAHDHALAPTMMAHPIIPAAGIAITLGVDRFLNEGRAVINLIGNAVPPLPLRGGTAPSTAHACERCLRRSTSTGSRLCCG